jgi:hypothetical protein
LPDLLINTTGEIAVYIEAEGAPVTGRTFTLNLTNPRGTEVVTGGSVVEQGGGWYGYTISATTLSLRGTYHAQWTSSGSPEIGVHTLHSCGWVPPGRPTLADLRERIFARIGALLHRGAISAGTVSSFVDTALVAGGLGEFAGCWVFVSSGANLGQERMVTQFDPALDQLTFAPPLPSVPSAGDRYLLLRLDGPVQPATVTSWINEAIDALGEQARIPWTDESVLTVAGQVEYEIPAGFVSLHAVQLWSADLDVWMALTPIEWEVVAGHMLRLTVPPGDSGLGVRLVGTTWAQPLYAEGQYVDVLGEYPIAFAVEQFHAAMGGGTATDPDEHRRAQAFYAQHTELQRRRAVNRIPPDSLAVAG